MRRVAHVPSATLSAREVLAAIRRPAAIAEVEHDLERRLGAPTVLFASARGALAAAIGVLAPGGSVALPGYTCVAVANAVKEAGGAPVWADVDDRGLVPEAGWPAADLCLVQDTYGFPAPIPSGRLVVRDAAHRVDALLDRPDAVAVTVASFEHSKSLSAGEGGIAVTSDAELAGRMRAARDRHAAPGTGRLHALVTLMVLGAGRAWFAGRRLPSEALTRAAMAVAPARMAGQSAVEMAGGAVDSRLLGPPPRAAATLVRSQLAGMAEATRHRRDLVRLYDAAAGVDRAPEPLLRYPLWADDPAAVAALMGDSGWDLGRPWFASPLHPCDPPPPAAGYVPGSAPHGELLTRHVVNLPTHPLVRPDHARALIGVAMRAGARPLR